MSFLEKLLKKVWYGDHEADVYDSHDFDELWKIEEQDSPQSFLSKEIGKNKGFGYQNLKTTTNKENTNVIEHPSLTPQSEVIVIEPRAFDEALDIIEELRCRRSVVLNLQFLDAEQSQRVVDFLSGATHALDGHQQRIGQGVFIFAPSNFTINAESQEARSLKDAFWGRKEKLQQQEEQNYQYQYSEPVKKSSIF